MSFKQFFPIPVIIAVQAFTMMLLDLFFRNVVDITFMQTWIAFQAWAMYFMAGCTVKNGARVMLGYAGGIAASIAIIELGMGPFAGLGDLAVPVAVLLVVVPVICAERVPMLNFVPAWFVGAGVFFAITMLPGADERSHADAAVMEIASCLWGLVYGWVTVLLRGKYEAMLKTGNGEQPAEQPAAETGDAQ